MFELEIKGVPSDFTFECLVCSELKLEVFVTACCGRVVCTNCRQGLSRCPRRCPGGSEAFAESEAVARAIKQLKHVCRYCDAEVHQSEAEAHQEKCRKGFVDKMSFVAHLWDEPELATTKKSSYSPASNRLSLQLNEFKMSPLSCNCRGPKFCNLCTLDI